MLTLLSELAEIALDVDVDRLRHAPTALEYLLHHVEHHDWRVLNVRHVREAAALAGALIDAKRLLRRLRRALVKLSQARGILLESIARIQDSYRGFLLPDLAGFEALCAGLHLLVDSADSHLVGSGSLLAGIDAQIEAVRGRWPKMNFAIPSSFKRYDLYIDLKQSILFLRRAQEKVDRRLSRLHPAALQEQAARLQETTHGVSRLAPQTLTIARSLSTSTSALADSAANSTYNVLIPRITTHLELLRARLAAPLTLPYEWFTAQVNVRSLRDIGELRSVSRLLLNHHDEPSHRIAVVVGGVRALAEAQGMHLQLMSCVDEHGWVVQGLPQLAQALMLDVGLSALKVALDRAHRGNVYSAGGEVVAPEYFDDVRDRASEVQDLIDSDLTVISSGVAAVLTRVGELLENQLNDKIFDVILELNAVQREDVIFV